MTQTSLGKWYLLAGVLAFFSGSYAIYTAFSDTAFGVFISGRWAFSTVALSSHSIANRSTAKQRRLDSSSSAICA